MAYKIKQDLEVSGTGTFTGNVSVPAGTTDSHVINKLQFDTAINDIRNRDDSKPSVKATVSSGEINETLPYVTVTGVTVDVGDRVLCVAPVFAGAVVANGPYIVQTGTWVRADDGTISSQSNWRVEQGTDAGYAYVVTTVGAIIPGTTPFTIVQIAAAASLVADSLGSTEIVSDEIRVKINTGSGDAVRILSSPSGLYVSDSDISRVADYQAFNHLSTISKVNVNLASLPISVGGVTLTLQTFVNDRPPFQCPKVLLTNQSTSSENGMYYWGDSTGTGISKASYSLGALPVSNESNFSGEVWYFNNGYNLVKRLSSPTYFQTLPAGAPATHTIPHNKRTTRPQVKLFDTVTNEELFAQPSNISLNSFDLVLSALTNDVQVVVNITPDA